MSPSEKGSTDEEEPLIRSFELNFQGWNFGGKLIFISTVIAILSLLLPWIGGDAEPDMGFGQGASVFLVAYIYPFFVLAQDKKMNNVVGFASSLLAIILPGIFLYYMSREMRLPMPEIISYGLLIFLVAGILLVIGVSKYVPYDRERGEPTKEEEAPVLRKKKRRGKPCPDCNSAMEYEEEWERWFCEECDEYK